MHNFDFKKMMKQVIVTSRFEHSHFIDYYKSFDYKKIYIYRIYGKKRI